VHVRHDLVQGQVCLDVGIALDDKPFIAGGYLGELGENEAVRVGPLDVFLSEIEPNDGLLFFE
jgi:hypothetical protein